jgi:uncharacterized membrane protein
MNLRNKALVVLLVALFFISVSSVSAVDYSLTNAHVDLEVQDNGLLLVGEEIDYHFDSSANGVYRDIPLKKGQSIENLEVYVEGAYYDYEIIHQGSQERVKVYLYRDAAKTKKITSGTDIQLYLEYYVPKAVRVYNDVGEIQYKVWGDEWDEDVDHFSATITFPESKELEYWINPPSSDAESNWEDNILFITSDGVSSGHYVEARALIPLSEFSDDAPYAQHINKNAKDEIENIQKDAENQQGFLNNVGSAMNYLLALVVAVPLAIYFKFGREPKTDYQGIYEHEPPTKDPPAFVNALMESMSKDVGDINEEAFQATIMDLINRGNLGVDSEEDTEFTKSTFVTVKNTEGLKRFENELIGILKAYELDGRISFSYMQDCLRSESQARSFQDRYNKWCDNFKKDYLPDNVLAEYFDNTGSDYLMYSGIGAIVLGILLVGFSMFFDFKGDFITMIIGVIMGIIGIGSFMVPSGIPGKYTLKGKLYAEKWSKFKEFLEDYSLIKEHPPESIAIWNEYLVYATALGVADEAYKNMKMHVYNGLNDTSYTTNDLFMFYYLGGNNHISSSFSTASSTISAADNSSIGGIGGGSGGGGGGAF